MTLPGLCRNTRFVVCRFPAALLGWVLDIGMELARWFIWKHNVGGRVWTKLSFECRFGRKRQRCFTLSVDGPKISMFSYKTTFERVLWPHKPYKCRVPQPSSAAMKWRNSKPCLSTAGVLKVVLTTSMTPYENVVYTEVGLVCPLLAECNEKDIKTVVHYTYLKNTLKNVPVLCRACARHVISSSLHWRAHVGVLECLSMFWETSGESICSELVFLSKRKETLGIEKHTISNRWVLLTNIFMSFSSGKYRTHIAQTKQH